MARDHTTSEAPSNTSANTSAPVQMAREDSSLSPETRADLSVWVIWGVIMLLAIAALPFAARSQDVVRAIATMCGIDLG